MQDVSNPAPQPGTLASGVYLKVRQAIIDARMLPGERLRVETLRALYGVGGTPVREALNRLSAEGLVSQEDQKGFRVASVSAQDLSELTRARCMLDGLLLRESMDRGDAKWEEAVIVALHRLTRASSAARATGLRAEWQDLHRSFHFTLLSACGSPPLLDASRDLFDRADRYRNLANAAQVGRDVDAEHKAIVDAALDRDADRATQLLSGHVLETAEALGKFLSSNGDNLVSLGSYRRTSTIV